MMIDYVVDGKKAREYWVVFTQGTHLISKVLKKNFSHIYIITRDQYNWMIINPLRLRLNVEIGNFPLDVDVPRLIPLSSDRVIKVKMYDRPTKKQFGYFGFINCVTYTKYILGLRLSALTPFQLYKKLLRLKTRDKAKHGILSLQQIV